MILVRVFTEFVGSAGKLGIASSIALGSGIVLIKVVSGPLLPLSLTAKLMGLPVLNTYFSQIDQDAILGTHTNRTEAFCLQAGGP